ncbi:unnamed protein product [Brassica rapa]|uniref:Uncharacterized protein n=1 Tax=Brassica campestris TaxID=3711 RepID=A0A8D9GM31_BRACM|nr:unnamed protein product [Brassica rapa]
METSYSRDLYNFVRASSGSSATDWSHDAELTSWLEERDQYANIWSSQPHSSPHSYAHLSQHMVALQQRKSYVQLAALQSQLYTTLPKGRKMLTKYIRLLAPDTNLAKAVTLCVEAMEPRALSACLAAVVFHQSSHLCVLLEALLGMVVRLS